MRNLIPLNEAKQLIRPHFNLLIECIDAGFNSFYQNNQMLIQENGNGYNQRTKATVIQNLVTRKLEEKIAEMENVRVSTVKNTFFLNFGDIAIAKVKKLSSKDLSPSNISTSRIVAFNNQRQLDGIPDSPTLLYIGYTINKTYTEIDSAYIVCRVNNHVQWYIDITNEISLEQTRLQYTSNSENQEVEIGKRVKIKPEIATIKKITGTNN